MKPEVSINLCVRSNFRTAEETYPVFVSGRVGDKRGYIGPTDIRVPSDITIKKNRPVGGSEAKRRLVLSQINKLLSVVDRSVEYLKSRGKLTLNNLRAVYKAGGIDTMSFRDLYEDYLEFQRSRVGGEITEGSYEVYENVGKNFLRFLDYIGAPMIPLDNITSDTIQSYITYLSKVKKRTEKTVNNLISCLKSYFIFALKKEYITRSPMVDYGYRQIPSTRVFLTRDEVSRVASCDISSAVNYVRDCYLLSCWTGLSYSDLKSLSLSELVTISGRTWIYKSRKKTHVPFAIPLIPPALELIMKYADKDHPFDPIFSHVPVSTVCTDHLRKIAKEAGIVKHLTFHTARHTFATMALSEGVSMESVSKMLGHASITTTAIYARITNEKVAREMAVFERNLCESEL